VHAAVNAILNKTRESIKGCTIYLTHFPDNDCVHAIIEAEIREVVYLKWKSCDDDDEKDERIKELLDNNSVELSREIMREEIKEEKDLKVVTELEYRIANKSDADANKAARTMAISWEQFFMGIAELSKTRPGEEKNPKIIVLWKVLNGFFRSSSKGAAMMNHYV
uniref:dCMP deaminase n=1 Tax=Amphimedon queenslandica TaxID=400682 RepID=A0A1X7T4R9_AMPQE